MATFDAAVGSLAEALRLGLGACRRARRTQAGTARLSPV
jgi:hypothetical protein